MAAEVLLPAVPFDSEETVDSQGNITYDRVAYSADYAKWWKTYFSNGILVNGGGNLTTEFQVSLKTTPTVTVKAGAVVINGRTGWLDQDVDIAMPVASGSVKYFMIVLELNIPNDRQIAIKVVEGKTYTSIMDGSALVQTDDIFQIPLAMVQQNSSGVINAVSDLRTRNQKWISNVNIGIKIPDEFSTENLQVPDGVAKLYGIQSEQPLLNDVLSLNSITPSYLAFVGNINEEQVSAALGKHNEERIQGVGMALAMYGVYKNKTFSINGNFYNLQQKSTLSDVFGVELKNIFEENLPKLTLNTPPDMVNTQTLTISFYVTSLMIQKNSSISLFGHTKILSNGVLFNIKINNKTVVEINTVNGLEQDFFNVKSLSELGITAQGNYSLVVTAETTQSQQNYVESTLFANIATNKEETI